LQCKFYPVKRAQNTRLSQAERAVLAQEVLKLKGFSGKLKRGDCAQGIGHFEAGQPGG